MGGGAAGLRLRDQSNNGEIIAPRIFEYAGTGGETPEAAGNRFAVRMRQGADGIKFFGMDHEPMAAMLDEARSSGCVPPTMSASKRPTFGTTSGAIRQPSNTGTASLMPRFPTAPRSFPLDYNYSNELDRFRWAGRLFKDADPEKLREVLQAMVDAEWRGFRR